VQVRASREVANGKALLLQHASAGSRSGAVWDNLDQNNDGRIEMGELRSGLRRMLQSESNEAVAEAADFIMEALDTDKDGHISKTEWNADSSAAPPDSPEEIERAMSSLNINMTQLREVILYAFDRFDLNGDGRIDLKEFCSASQLMGLEMGDKEARIVFCYLSDDGETILSEDFRNKGWDTWSEAVTKAMTKQYAKKGLARLQYVFTCARTILTEDHTPKDKFQQICSLLGSQSETLFEGLELVFDLTGLWIAFAGVRNELACFPNCKDEIDFGSLAPFMFFMYICTRDITKHIKEATRADLDESTALAYSRVFKPAGMSVDSFLLLNEQANAAWREVRKGEAMVVNNDDATLFLVVRGAVEVLHKGPLAFRDDLAVLGPGSFVGALSFLAEREEASASGSTSAEHGGFVASEDSLLLTWSASRLRQFLSCDEEIQGRFRGIVAQSLVAGVGHMKQVLQQRAGEHKELFEMLTRCIQKKFNTERATMWIYRQEEDELWTILLGNQVSDFFLSVRAKGGSLAAAAFCEDRILVVPDCYADPRFNSQVDVRTGFTTRNMLCSPVNDHDSKAPIAVLQVINKLDRNARRCDFSQEDLRAAKELSWTLSPVIKKLFLRYRHRKNSLG